MGQEVAIFRQTDEIRMFKIFILPLIFSFKWQELYPKFFIFGQKFFDRKKFFRQLKFVVVQLPLPLPVP